MPVDYGQIKALAKDLYASSLTRVPDDMKDALRRASENESSEVGRNTLFHMLESANTAESRSHFVCSDAGIPVYFVQIGTRVQWEGNIRQAFVDGFDELTQTIEPPLLKHVTNPLTLERGYKGKDMPIVTFDLLDGADYVDIVCAPKGFGAGRWAALELFSYPTIEVIEKYVLEVVVKAGSRTCPPVVIGVGIGGTFDHAAKIAKKATLRRIGESNPDPIAAGMEERLLKAVNQIGFGPMGTGGDTTAVAVNVEFSSGHGFTPVAVSFNCWINRRSHARIYNSGEIIRYES